MRRREEGLHVNRALQKYIEAASGLTNLTASKAERIVKQLVRSGEAAGDQVGEMVDDLLAKQKQNRDAVGALVKSETTRAVHAMGMATSAEVERLQKQVAELRRQLSRLERDTAARPAKATAKKAARRSGAKKGTAKKGTKKATKQATAKKATKKSTGGSR